MNINVTNYNFDYDLDLITINTNMNNRLFCTFTPEDSLDDLLQTIQDKYTVMYGKIFVLKSKNSEEYICTYNIELGNVNEFLPNTILVHRKKETNTLYTINALNSLIKELNNGVLDTAYAVDWKNYRNTILLTKGEYLRKLTTKLHKIVEL